MTTAHPQTDSRLLDEIKRSEARLQEIVDVIPQTITVLDAEGTIIYANQAALDYTGLSVDDVMKPDFRERIFHPEDIERLRDERTRALLRGLPFENEQRARGRDGTYRWFLIRSGDDYANSTRSPSR